MVGDSQVGSSAPTNTGLLLRVAAVVLQHLDRSSEAERADLTPPTEPTLDDVSGWLATLAPVATRVLTKGRAALQEPLGSGIVRVIPTRSGYLVQSRFGLVMVTTEGERKVAWKGKDVAAVLPEGEVRVIEVEPRLSLEPLSQRTLRSHSPWRRLAALMRLERVDLVALLVYAVVLGGLSLAVPVAVQVMVNTIAFGSLLQPLVVLSLLLLAVLTFYGTLRAIEAYAVEVLQRRLFVRVSEDFARRLPLVRYDAHDARDVRELSNRFFDVITLQKSVGSLLLSGLSLVLQTLVGLALLAFYHPLLLAFDAVLLICLALVVGLGRGAVPSAIDESNEKFKVGAFLQTLAERPHLYRNPAGGQYAAIKGSSLTLSYLTARRGHFRKVFRQLVGGIAIQVLAMTTLLGLGGLLVMRGELTLGQLVAAELVVGMIGAGVAKLGKHFETAYDLLASLDKLGKVIDLPLESTPVHDARHTTPLRVTLGEQVVEPGARVKLSSTSRVACTRFLEACAGLRTWPGLRLATRGGPRPSLFQCAYLARAGDVVPGSLLDNLRLSDPSVTEDEALTLLCKVGLDDLVSRSKEGLHSRILAHGAPLSPAEIARLSLARAILGQRGLLLLDGVLDMLELPETTQEALLDWLFDADSPWTILVFTQVDSVRERCTGSLVVPQEVTA